MSARSDSSASWALGTLLAAMILALRLPLWLLPGPGRDEAAYHYWAHHPEPVYSPLVQISVRIFEMIGGHSLWALRAPVILLGLLVLWLNDQRLVRASATPGWRWLTVFALASTPWQSFAGSILHPDDFMLAALLALVLAVQQKRHWLAVGAAFGAVAAKPTGIIFLPAVWWLADYMTPSAPRQRSATRGALVVIAAVFALTMKPDMIAGMAEFGRMTHVAWPTRILAGGVSLLFLGGPLLLGLGWWGLRRHWQHRRLPGSAAALVLAVTLLAVFLAAALVRGQFKGNWVLPAFVLLWPAQAPQWSRPAVARGLLLAALAVTILGSAVQTLVLAHPATLDRIEQELQANQMVPGWLSYRTQAGVREESVSSSRSWSDHVGEYRNAAAFADSIRTAWHEHEGPDVPVPWIVASDYGLACQLHWFLGNPQSRIAIYGDGIFHRSWRDLAAAAPTEPVLALSLPRSRALQILTTLPPVAHPVTRRILRPCVARWRSSKQETRNVEVH